MRLSHKGYIISKRYITISTYGVIAWSFFDLLMATRLGQTTFQSWAIFYTTLSLWLQLTIVCFAGALISFFLRMMRVSHPQHKFKTNIKYPSLRLTIVGVVVIWSCINRAAIGLAVSENAVSIPIYLAAFAMSAFCFNGWLEIRMSKSDRVDGNHSEGTLNLGDTAVESFDIKKWMIEEEPIFKETSDFFDRSIYVNRIYERLSKVDGKGCNHIALVGGYGSGKTSICRLLEERFKEKSFLFVYVDGWGRKDLSVTGQILELTIDKLSEVIDCSAFNSLPSHYTKALEGSNIKSIKVLTALLGHSSKPEKKLSELDSVLKAINYNVVIILEDFDRNPDSSVCNNQLPALLDRLRKLQKVSFILSIGPKSSTSGNLERVCSYREDLININPSNLILDLIGQLRKKAWEEGLYFSGTFDDEQRWVMSNRVSEAILNVDFFKFKALKEASRVITNPRDLKHIVRRTFEIWDKLKGEVLLEELFLVNTIRYVAPDFLELIKNSYKNVDENDIDYRNFVSSELRDNPNFISCLVEITKELLPDPEKRPVSHMDLSRPQSISSVSSTNYLDRILYEYIPENELRDQTVINSLIKWRINPDCILFEGCTMGDALNKIDNLAPKIIDFAPCLFGDELIDRIKQLFESALEHVEKSAQADIPYPGSGWTSKLLWFDSFFNVLKNDFKSDNTGFYLKQAESALQYSLRLAHSIQHKLLWSETDKKKFIEKFFLEIDTANKLLDRLDEDHVYTVVHYFNLIQAVSPEKLELFGCLIIEALRINPKMMLPFIAHVIVNSDPNEVMEQFQGITIDEKRMESLFGSKVHQLIVISSEVVNLGHLDQREQAYVYALQDYARERLEDKNVSLL